MDKVNTGGKEQTVVEELKARLHLKDIRIVDMREEINELDKRVEPLKARVKELEEWAIARDNEQGRKIKKSVDENESLQARVKELESDKDDILRAVKRTDYGYIRSTYLNYDDDDNPPEPPE